MPRIPRGFRRIDISRRSITDNIFRMLGEEWFLVTAGTMKHYNTMTAAWGGLGYLWNRCIAIACIRPHRYTYRFVERRAGFTLSFFDRRYRKALSFCGTHSGRDVDKAKETGLTAVATSRGNVFFQEARLVLECRKIYQQDIDPRRFLDRSIHRVYPQRDYHRMYIGEIVSCLVRK